MLLAIYVMIFLVSILGYFILFRIYTIAAVKFNALRLFLLTFYFFLIVSGLLIMGLQHFQIVEATYPEAWKLISLLVLLAFAFYHVVSGKMAYLEIFAVKDGLSSVLEKYRAWFEQAKEMYEKQKKEYTALKKRAAQLERQNKKLQKQDSQAGIMVTGQAKLKDSWAMHATEFLGYYAKEAKEVSQMSKHYADMITFSLADKEYDFSDLMNATTKFYRKIALAKGQNLTLKRYKKFAAQLSLKGSELQYIVAALLDNAIRFTPKDGIIDIHISNTKDAVDIVIVDSGTGMKSQDIEAMLEPGVSGKQVMNQGKQKDGLGLHIIRELLKSKQGSLFIGNNEPQGLIVTVRIPFLRK